MRHASVLKGREPTENYAAIPGYEAAEQGDKGAIGSDRVDNRDGIAQSCYCKRDDHLEVVWFSVSARYRDEWQPRVFLYLQWRRNELVYHKHTCALDCSAEHHRWYPL